MVTTCIARVESSQKSNSKGCQKDYYITSSIWNRVSNRSSKDNSKWKGGQAYEKGIRVVHYLLLCPSSYYIRRQPRWSTTTSYLLIVCLPIAAATGFPLYSVPSGQLFSILLRPPLLLSLPLLPESIAYALPAVVNQLIQSPFHHRKLVSPLPALHPIESQLSNTFPAARPLSTTCIPRATRQPPNQNIKA